MRIHQINEIVSNNIYFRFVKSLDTSITNALADATSDPVELEKPQKHNNLKSRSKIIPSTPESSNDSTRMNNELATNLKSTSENQNSNTSASNATNTKLSSNSSLNSGVQSLAGPTYENEDSLPTSNSLGSQSTNCSPHEKTTPNGSLKRLLVENSDTSEGSNIPSKKMSEEKLDNKTGAYASTSQEFGANDESRGSYDELD